MQNFLFSFVFIFTAATLFADDSAFQERLHRDWMYQDHGLNVSACFTSEVAADNKTADNKTAGNKTANAMVNKVLDELDAAKVDTKALRDEAAGLENTAGNDARWKTLYFKACGLRRQHRLAGAAASQPLQILYTKHYVLSGPCQMHPTDMVTDNPYKEQLADFRTGGQLCRMTVQPDGSVSDEVLLESKDGLIRDPNLSYDGTRIVFSMRNNFKDDDYHLYTMSLAAAPSACADSVQQITFGKACSDVEPAFLPDGNIVFQSTRCVQLTDCWPVPVSNLYICDAQGRSMRRVGFDQVHTLYPQVLDDGTVIYTRWEYNDRNPVHQQPLFQMNIDGTAQSVYYGGGEFFPTSIIHARGVPGTNKVIAVASGHHTDQRGKLMMIDRSRGTDGNAGITFLAPVSTANVPKTTRTIWDQNDRFGQGGGQFQYPFALDEHNYLVAYLPEGGPKAKYPIPFGVYWMNADGKRELLAFDPKVSCGQQIPVIARKLPPVKPSQIDLAQNTGKYYVQDIYIGKGLAGIERGTVKTMRVVGLEFRAAHVLDGSTQGESLLLGARGARDRVTTPIASGSGSWDVKHVLGEVPVEEDGSVYVEVPARTPVFFQLLDEKGYCVQTMRSWTTLQPGETFACIGCHEDKTAAVAGTQLTAALRKPVRKLLPAAYNFGAKPVDAYLTVNSPSGNDGFSYPKQIQPILDKHCIQCHDGANDKTVLNLKGIVHENLENDKQKEHPWKHNGRAYLTSYLQLVNYGVSGKLINWVDAESVPMVLPPYFNGSAKSKVMEYLESVHYEVKLSAEEKKTVACWIDLCVPFCGSYTEANQWTDKQKELYRYFEEKRTRFAELEIEAAGMAVR